MATALTNATFAASVSFSQPNGNPIFPQTFAKALNWQQAFTSGIGAKQVNRLSCMQFTIAASGTLSVNVVSGTYSGAGSGNIVDLNGAAIIFARLKGVAIELVQGASCSTQVHVNAAVTHAALTLAGKIKTAGTATGGEGGLLWWDNTATGEAVVTATNDVIAIVNDDASFPALVNLLIAGGAT